MHSIIRNGTFMQLQFTKILSGGSGGKTVTTCIGNNAFIYFTMLANYRWVRW